MVHFSLRAGIPRKRNWRRLRRKPRRPSINLLRAPATVAKTLQGQGDAANAQLQDAVGQTESTKTNSEAPVPVEQKPDQLSPWGFSAVGRRDPFRPFTLNPRTTTGSRENLSPLERYELGN